LTTAEVVDTISVASNTVLKEAYLYNASPLNTNQIPSGVWDFVTYAGVDLATGVSEILINVMKVVAGTGTITTSGSGTSRTAIVSSGAPFVSGDADADFTVGSFLQTPSGLYPITAFESTDLGEVTITTPTTYTVENNVSYSIWRRLFQVTTGEINNTASGPAYAGLQAYNITSAQAAITTLATDKIAAIYFGKNPTSTRSIYFTHNGTTRYSRFSIPSAVSIGLVKDTRAITVAYPTASEDQDFFFTESAITISKMVAVLNNGAATPSVTWTIKHATDRSAAGAEVVTGGTTTTSISTGSVIITFNDATIPANSFVWLETTAQSGTVPSLSVSLFSTYDV
jgi:hypothetical protein